MDDIKLENWVDELDDLIIKGKDQGVQPMDVMYVLQDRANRLNQVFMQQLIDIFKNRPETH